MPKVSSHALDPIIMVLGKHEFDLRTLASPHVINVWVFPWDREAATRGQRRLGLSPNLSFSPQSLLTLCPCIVQRIAFPAQL